MTVQSPKEATVSFARPALIVALMLLAAPAWTAPTKEELARWVRQLGDNSFAAREEATRKLWEAGRAAESVLQTAAKSDDPEVARRARDLVEKFKWGIYADTPPKIVDLITRYQGADRNGKLTTVKELFDQGASGCTALLKIASAEDDATLKRAVLQLVAAESGRAIPGLLAEGNFATLDELLELAVVGEMESAVPSYAEYHLLRGRLDEKIAYWKPLAAKEGNPHAAEVLAQLYRAKGDPAAARQAAEKANRPDLLEAILLEQRDFKELAKRSLAQDRPQTPFELGYRAAYQRLAGTEKPHRDEFESAIADLRKLAEKVENDHELWMIAKVLFLNDRPADGLEMLLKQGPGMGGPNGVHIFEILCGQQRYREALELAGKIEDGKRSPALEVLRARTLHLLGEKDKAKELFDHLATLIKADNEETWPDSLVQWEYRLGRKDQAFEHAARALAAVKSTGNQARLLDKVFPGRGESAGYWWRFLRSKHANEDASATMKRLREVMTGKLPAKDLTALAEEAEQTMAALPLPERERALLALAEVCKTANLDTATRGYLEKSAAVQGSAASLLKLGDYLAEKKQWEQAAEQYGKAWEKDRREALPLYLRGWALTQGDREKEGRKLMDLAHWLPLGQENLRSAFLDALVKRGHLEAARKERELLLRSSRPGSFYAGEAMRQAGVEAYAKKDYLKAADGNELAMLRVLRPNVSFVESGAHVGVPHFIHRLRARGLVATGKIDEARREIEACEALQPANVELAVLLVPELEKRGYQKDADAMLKKLLDVHEQTSKDYPNSAANHNSLAWMLACCRKQLDKALEHARKAVEQAPEQAGYLDTLAEVHFQRGDKEQAIALMKKCVEMEPTRPFFRKQLKRFAAGDPNADLPNTVDDDD